MKDKDKKYNMTFDNLAIPEVSIGDAEPEGDETGENDKKKGTESITYDTVAIPEIHIKR